MRCKDTIIYPDSQVLAFLKSVKHFIKKVPIKIDTFNYELKESLSTECVSFVHRFLQLSLEHVDEASQLHLHPKQNLL